MFKMLLSYRYLDNKRLDQSKTDDQRSTTNPDNLSGSPSIQGKSSNTYFTMKTYLLCVLIMGILINYYNHHCSR